MFSSVTLGVRFRTVQPNFAATSSVTFSKIFIKNPLHISRDKQRKHKNNCCEDGDVPKGSTFYSFAVFVAMKKGKADTLRTFSIVIPVVF